MTTCKRLMAAVALGMLITSGVYAVEPAYLGPLGNPEEPATRPYKWAWNGVKAFAHRTVTSLERGNVKTPGLGSVEVVRGMRQGSLELTESVFHGVNCAVPPAPDAYKKNGKLNALVEKDPLIRNAADLAAGAVLLPGVFGAAPNAALGLGTFAAQKTVDLYPYNSPIEQEKLLDEAKAKRAEKQAERRAAVAGKNQLDLARKNYLGERNVDNKKTPYTGNIMKQLR